MSGSITAFADDDFVYGVIMNITVYTNLGLICLRTSLKLNNDGNLCMYEMHDN